MTEFGLKDAFSLVYAENTTPHLLSGKAINRALRGIQLVDLAVNTIFNGELLNKVNFNVKRCYMNF